MTASQTASSIPTSATNKYDIHTERNMTASQTGSNISTSETNKYDIHTEVYDSQSDRQQYIYQ